VDFSVTHVERLLAPLASETYTADFAIIEPTPFNNAHLTPGAALPS
jgi:hypothetical protein